MILVPAAPARGGRTWSATGLRSVRAVLDTGLEHNTAGRPQDASEAFRAVLRSLGPEPQPGTGSDPHEAYLRARALLGLVMSDFELRADHVRSRAALDAAARWADVAGAGPVRVAIEGQRGLLEMRAGRPEEAVRALDRAASRLPEAEPRDACVLLLNRGSLHLELGHLRRAQEDLESCARRATALGHPLLEFQARHNLGYGLFLAGDLPAALGVMADAARIEHDGSLAVALLDRARVLLEAGLVGEADATLARAGDLLVEQRLEHDLAHVELTRARCALVSGDPRSAVGWASSARRRFGRRGNRRWQVEATLVLEKVRLALLEADPVAQPAAARRLARRVEAAVDGRTPVARGTARSAHLVVAEALVLAGDLVAARAAVRRAGRRGPYEPLSTAVHAHAVRARLAFAAGDLRQGQRHVRAGQELLADHRRRLGSVEAVTAGAVHGERLAVLEATMALSTQRPEALLDAVERGRAAFAGPARVTPPKDPALADLLARLRRCVEAQRELTTGPTGGAEPAGTALRREAATLSERLREGHWRLGDGVPAPEPVRGRDLVAAVRGVHGRAVANLVVLEGRVRAVVVDGRGARLLDLAEAAPVLETARRVRTDLAALAGRELPSRIRQTVSRSLERRLRLLDEALVRPLRAEDSLHVVAPGPLVAVPWGLLPSRRGRPTVVGPRLGTLGRGPAPAGETVAVAGPGLEHAEAEARAVAETWPAGRVLAGPGATVTAVAQALQGAPMVHVAAHGRHEPENPLFSSLRLADGPLFAYELEQVVPGATVVLSACELGRTTVRVGGEVLGLASVLLRLGAGAVVAALAPVRDEAIAAVMPSFHRLLAAGASPAVALARASSALEEPLPLSCFTLAVDTHESVDR